MFDCQVMGAFSPLLQSKIDQLAARRRGLSLGRVKLASPLVLAPMSAICSAPFRLLMEELGAGGTVSELVSCHGINRSNQRTLKMLRVDRREKNVGIQLFGEDATALARSAEIASGINQKWGGGMPRFIDINMGCPVRKVVSKGGGAALLREPSKLGAFFREIRRDLQLPLSIKIRTGWDQSGVNAAEVVEAAAGEGIEFVAIHGRTRSQQYCGRADWKLLEGLAKTATLPLIGNGDLRSWEDIRQRLQTTALSALMIGRGALRQPFLFLTSLLKEGEADPFHAGDYWEVVERYQLLLEEFEEVDSKRFVQLRKMILWCAAGFPRAGIFRKELFACQNLAELLELAGSYFDRAGERGERKCVDFEASFMAGGHG